MQLKNRLNAHFAACAVAAAGAVAVTPQADAAIVYSGVVNLNIAATTNGLYLNVVTGALNEPGNTNGATVPGWDINPWGSTSFNLFSPSTGAAYAQVGNNMLASGTLVSAASTFATSTAATNAAAINLNSDNNFIGFRFFREGDAAGTFHYGWARLAFTSSTFSAGRSLVEYAYEDEVGVGILVGAGVPAPGAIALLGVAGLVGSRRRRVA